MRLSFQEFSMGLGLQQAGSYLLSASLLQELQQRLLQLQFKQILAWLQQGHCLQLFNHSQQQALFLHLEF